ncbi:unnamed protein product [Prunus brigantina]
MSSFLLPKAPCLNLIGFLTSSSSSLNNNFFFPVLQLQAKTFIASKRFDFSVTMVSQAPSKDSSLNKNECKELKVSKPQTKPSKKMKFVSSAKTEPGSTTTFYEEPKSSCGINTMPRVVKRKLQKIKPVIEYNKRGKPYGPAHTKMQSYIGVLARSKVPIVDKKWTEIPKDIKEHI